MRFVQVAVPVPVRKLFTYRVPDAWEEKALLGCRCRVPFGRSGEKMGYVVAEAEKLPKSLDREKIKPLGAVLDERPTFSPAMLDFTRWAAEHYVASWGEMLRAAHPVRLSAKARRRYSLTPKGRDAATQGKGKGISEAMCRVLDALGSAAADEARELTLRGLSRALGEEISASRMETLVRHGWVREESTFVEPRKGKYRLAVECLREAEAGEAGPAETLILRELKKRGEAVPVAELSPFASDPHAVVRRLRAKGLVRVFQQRILRDPFWDKPPEQNRELTLTGHQEKVFRAALPALRESRFQPVLLHGVTGSGKTEVYIRLIREALGMGRRALYLVPEIGLTPLTAARLRAHFAANVAILHSGLDEGERYDEWERVRRGEVDLVVGTRSAVFAPIESLGLVVVDEEHDPSYKQEESPYYNGRDLAVVRAQRDNAVVFLGSATPSTETYFNACGDSSSSFPSTRKPRKAGYLSLALPERIEKRPLPGMRLVDMTKEFQETGERKILSRALEEALMQCVARGEQAMLLLNRRGYAPFVLCRECGYTPDCEHCSVMLTLHTRGGRRDANDGKIPASAYLMCHYCGHREKIPRRCPECEGEFLQMVGHGTEQVETYVRSLLAGGARTLRLDRDTASLKDAHHRILSAFGRGEAQVLVGTQMIAKGHDFPNVTLVGVVSADTGLAFPDFRAAERTFQLLTQVAGRAGRAERPGEVFIQTVNPRHYAVEMAVGGRVAEFYRKELWFRRVMKYPPYTAMAIVLARDRNEEKAVKLIKKLARALREAGDPRVAVLGPAPAPLAKIKDVHRYHVVLKSSSRGRLRSVLDKALGSLKRLKRESVRINVDPVNVL
ncbi:MAG: primosomal protein N' [Acidobacteriota bacterium]|nr:MAG: primosomal protein N' [Acidobacteriota bacterium]